MPRRESEPPPRGSQSEPFETTGAFALPTDSAGDPPPANDPAGAFPPPSGPFGDQAGPFETTGAFVRPPEWDAPPGGPGGPGAFGGPGGQSGPSGPARPGGPGDRRGPGGPDAFDGPATGAFTVPADGPDLFGRGGGGNSFFDRPGDETAHFGGPNGPDGPFGGPGGPDGPFGGPNGPGGPFGGPGGPDGPFGGPSGPNGPFGGPGDRTAGFDRPSGPAPSGPPEPGDIKVAGEPTAIQAPAWAEAETGFLASGWSSDSGLDEPDEPKGRRGRRKARRDDDEFPAAAPVGGAGKGRVALLSVAAVAVVLGGTVAGVKLMSSSGGAQCEGATCAAVQAPTGQPGPVTSDDPPVEEEAAPEEEPALDEEETTPSETPTPTATYAARAPRRTTTPTPTPTPTKTKVKKTETPAEPTEEPEPTPDDNVTISPSENPSTLDNGSDTPTVGTSSDPPADTGAFGSGSSGPTVNVKQTIKQGLAMYSAELTFSNTSQERLERPTISMPVEGRVLDVDGAQWTQDGDLLILDLSESLEAGGSADVSFTATGTGVEAATCGMVSGECAVS